MSSNAADNFYADYFSYIGDSESPTNYHRWVAISAIAALLGRQYFLPFGHSILYPNFYIMLIGNPGTRKGTAMTPAKNILKEIGYNKFSPDRTSVERFIYDLKHSSLRGIMKNNEDNELELEDLIIDEPAELYAMADEFADFIGQSPMSFINALTKLWDNPPEYEHPKLHGKSVLVREPTVNILAGTTPQSLSLTIPVEAIGQGFMSRFIVVHGEATGKKITFPTPPSREALQKMAELLVRIKETVKGALDITEEAKTTADKIYKNFIELADYRFRHYSTRRFTHIIKLAVVFSAMRFSTKIESCDFICANTLLHYTEQKMSKALGEFGKAKHSDVANTVLDAINHAKSPIPIRDIWKLVSQDLNKLDDLVDIVKNLQTAGKIQAITKGDKQGFLPLKEIKESWDKSLLWDDFLFREERA